MKKSIFIIISVALIAFLVSVIVLAFLTPPEDKVDLGNDYLFSYRRDEIYNDRWADLPRIFGHIKWFDFNREFIVAKQSTSRDVKSVKGVRNQTGYSYWIIDKRIDIIYGPLTIAEYDSICATNNIHLQLQ